MTGAHAPSSAASELKPLTSLRFFAAAMIVLYHSNNYYSADWKWISAVTPYMPFGVSFFFILSGFILAHVYSDRPKFSYRSFLLRRIARLWPMHVFATFVLVVLVDSQSITFDGPGWFNRYVVLVANLSLVHSLGPTVSYIFSWNAVSWSISTEFFFYLAFPVLMTIPKQNWYLPPMAFAALGLLLESTVRASGISVLPTDVNAVGLWPLMYANPISRGFEFTLGMFAWRLWRSDILQNQGTTVSSMIEIVALCSVVGWIASFPMWSKVLPTNDALWPSFTFAAIPLTLLIIATASGSGVFGQLLSMKPLVTLGRLSFSIYMLHQILMKASTLLPKIYLTELNVFLAIFLAAVIAHFAVERPGKRAVISLGQLAYKTVRPRRQAL